MTAVGTAGIPVLFLARGFLFSFSVAAFCRCFGPAGMALFGAALGVSCCLLAEWRKRGATMAEHLIYAQIAMYMALSFFTTWFSNPTTWFYLGMTGAVCWYVGRGGKRRKRGGRGGII